MLSSDRRPWLLIDPKPYVGDPHYDVLQHLLNCNESLQGDPIGLLTEVADLAGLDAGRVGNGCLLVASKGVWSSTRRCRDSMSCCTASAVRSPSRRARTGTWMDLSWSSLG